MSEHTVYAHGIRDPDETDAAVARRVARHYIGAHARNARVTQRNGDRVMVAAEVDVLTRPDGTRVVMVRVEWSAELVPRLLPPVERVAAPGRHVEMARLSSPVDADGAPVEVTR